MVNYREIPLQHSYISCGETNIANSFLNPVLGYTKLYKRSVGFFSSSVFSLIKEGIVKLARNKGEIRLIASPHLSQEDIQAIQMGYDKREKIVSDSFSRDFVEKLDELKEEELLLLVDLIAKGFLDIKIAVSNTDGIYHDKLGILEDEEGNKIAFYGSSNSSLNGYQKNYEKIRIARSWIPGEVESVEDEQNDFVNQNGKVKIRKGKMNELYKFITDDSAYSIEHFIISETKSKKITVDGNDYTIDDAIYKRYVNNFFNFIFIEQQINTDLGNSWLPEKLEKLKNKNISCEYSFMVVDKAAKLGSEFEKRAGDDYKDKLDLFFAREFKDVYIEYTKDTLNGIIQRINGYMDAMDI